VKFRRWTTPDDPLPKRPYRDSALFHLVLAGIIVAVAWLTGGSLSRALAFAAGFFVIATGWSWWRWNQRLAREQTSGKSATRSPQ
jgi:nicotinamide riboside transporter PnuC